jgi:hypothetical protein|uniref:Uncharacterized protein n=1 Tax=viral metagenome TaxID=1070528 RepID=A0A6C0LW41_9ZZZZ
MIPNLILQERLMTGIESIKSYNSEFMVNTLSILVFIFAFFIITIKRFNKKTIQQKKTHIEDFYQKVINYTN